MGNESKRKEESFVRNRFGFSLTQMREVPYLYQKPMENTRVDS